MKSVENITGCIKEEVILDFYQIILILRGVEMMLQPMTNNQYWLSIYLRYRLIRLSSWLKFIFKLLASGRSFSFKVTEKIHLLSNCCWFLMSLVKMYCQFIGSLLILTPDCTTQNKQIFFVDQNLTHHLCCAVSGSPVRSLSFLLDMIY